MRASLSLRIHLQVITANIREKLNGEKLEWYMSTLSTRNRFYNFGSQKW